MKSRMDMITEIEHLKLKVKSLHEIINNPEIQDFIEGIKLEATHQINRWGKDHDNLKTPEDWLWLLAYLATKASQSSKYKDLKKYKHHIITCAAACLNWHKYVSK